MFVPSFMKILAPWVRVWLVPKEEWTRRRILCRERLQSDCSHSVEGTLNGDPGRSFVPQPREARALFLAVPLWVRS